MRESNTQERLKEMMEIFNLKQSDIVKRTGVSKSALSNYISGKRVPNQQQLSIIAEPYGINPAWLMGYDVDISILPKRTDGSNDDKEVKKLYKIYEDKFLIDSLSQEERDEIYDFVTQLAKLPPESRQMILNMLRSAVPHP